MSSKKLGADIEQQVKSLSDGDIVTEPKASRRLFMSITSGCLFGGAAIVAGCSQAGREAQPSVEKMVNEKMPAPGEPTEEVAAAWTDTTADDNDVRRLADVGSLYNGTDKSTFRDPFKNKDKPKVAEAAEVNEPAPE